MSLKKLSRPQQEVIEAIAHMQVVHGLSQNVEGFEKFFDFYMDRVITRKHRQIYEEYTRTVQRVHKDMAEMMKDEDAFSD